MRHWTKVLTLVLSLLFLLNLTACGKQDKGSRLEEVMQNRPTEQRTTAPPLVTAPPEVTEAPAKPEATEPPTTTTPEPTDPPRSGNLYAYLLSEKLDKKNLTAVSIGIENQSNRKIKNKKDIELQELKDGSWTKLQSIPFELTLEKETSDFQYLDLSKYNLEGKGRTFRLLFSFSVLNRKGDEETSETVLSQNFDLSGGKAKLDEGETVTLSLNKQRFTKEDLAFFTIFVENKSAKYVMVVRNFQLEVLVEGAWQPYSTELGFSMDDNWYIHPGETDKQSYNLKPYNLDPNVEAYRVVKSYGLFYEADGVGESDTFTLISQPFLVVP